MDVTPSPKTHFEICSGYCGYAGNCRCVLGEFKEHGGSQVQIFKFFVVSWRLVDRYFSVDLRENLQETIDFPMKIMGFSRNISLKPTN